MPTSLVTPSAKSHERVTSRWVRDIPAADSNEWTVYYAKLAFGTPVPWLISIFAAATFTSRAVSEIAAWSIAGLTALYVLADLFSRTREFRFFRLGSDFMLFGVVAVGLAGALAGGFGESTVNAMGALRWMPLLYLLVYAWELFPGLNRNYGILTAFAVASALLAIWQNFSGIGVTGERTMSAAPAGADGYFAASGFFDSPEAFGTALAAFLPLPVMAFTLGDRKEIGRWFALAIVAALSLAIFFTYRPGIWISGGAGVFIALLMPGARQWVVALAIAASVGLASLCLYPSSSAMYDGVSAAQSARSTKQREQINEQVKIWQESPWIGSGLQSVEAARLDSSVGNVYFQILAQTGALGLSFYLLFSLGFLLSAYRILQEVPRTHRWHRVLVSGGIAGLVAFHAAGLFWFTLSEALAANLFCFVAASLAYVREHYSRGFVPDDYSL